MRSSFEIDDDWDTSADLFTPKNSLLNKRILVVDDEADLRELIAEAFVLEGAVVMIAAGGSEAFEIAMTSQIDVVISDRSMPEGDGITLMDRIFKLQGSEPYYVLMSGYGKMPAPDLYERGVGAIFSKPFSIQALVENVRTAMLPSESRWVRPLDISAVDSLLIIRNPNPPEPLNPKFQIGRHGLFIATSDPSPENSLVAFDVCTSTGRPFRGIGICRFVRTQTDDNSDGMGLEFKDLTEESYLILLEHLNHRHPRATIPKKNAR